MCTNPRTVAALGTLLMAMAAGGPVLAQKQGGVLKLSHFDSPASMSILEESTRAALQPMMGVFNNLVVYDQQIAQSSLETVRPDLATSWSWSEDGKDLTFPLRQGVKWHDGKPFTAADVKCTWDLLTGKSSEKLRLNPRNAPGMPALAPSSRRLKAMVTKNGEATAACPTIPNTPSPCAKADSSPR